MHAPGLPGTRSAPIAPVISSVLSVIPAVVAAIMAAPDAFADHCCGSDDRSGPCDRPPDHAWAPNTSSR